MPERSNNFNSQSFNGFRDSVFIDCNKIMDSCRDKDCLEDLKVFLTDYSQEILDRATNIRCKDAEILWTHVTVEPVPACVKRVTSQFLSNFYQTSTIYKLLIILNSS